MTTDVERAFHMPDHGFDAECESDGDGDDFGLIPVGQATRLRANPRAGANAAGVGVYREGAARLLPFLPGTAVPSRRGDGVIIHDGRIPRDLIPTGTGFLILDQNLSPVAQITPGANFEINPGAVICLVGGRTGGTSVVPQHGTVQCRVRRDALDEFLGGRAMPIGVDAANLDDTADLGRLNGGVYGAGHTRVALVLANADALNHRPRFMLLGIQGYENDYVVVNVATQ